MYTGKWKGAIDVAVKTMKPGTMSVEKFLEEAEVMKKLRHERLVTLYAVCTQEEPIYIVTELMPGGSLLALLRRQTKRRQNMAINVIIDMAAQVSGFSIILITSSAIAEKQRVSSACLSKLAN